MATRWYFAALALLLASAFSAWSLPLPVFEPIPEPRFIDQGLEPRLQSASAHGNYLGDVSREAANHGKSALSGLLLQGTHSANDLHDIKSTLSEKTHQGQEFHNDLLNKYLEAGHAVDAVKMKELHSLVDKGFCKPLEVVDTAIENDQMSVVEEFLRQHQDVKLNGANVIKVLSSPSSTINVIKLVLETQHVAHGTLQSAISNNPGKFAKKDLIDLILPQLSSTDEDNLLLGTLVRIAAGKGDFDLVQEVLQKRAENNQKLDLLYGPETDLFFFSLRDKEKGTNLVKYLIEHQLPQGNFERYLILSLKQGRNDVADMLLNGITKVRALDEIKFIDGICEQKTSKEDQFPIKVLKYVYDHDAVSGTMTNDIIYQLVFNGDKTTLDWVLANTKISGELSFSKAVASARKGSQSQRVNKYPDHSGAIETLRSLYKKITEKFPNIEITPDDYEEYKVKVKNVDQTRPLKDFYNLVMELPDSFRYLVAPDKLGLRKTRISYEDSIAGDMGGVTKDFISKSLSRLFTLDPKTILPGDFVLEHALVKADDEKSESIRLNDIFIDPKQLSNENNQELLKNYEFLGRSMGYALNAGVPSSHMDFQISTLHAILGSEMNMKTVIKDNNYLLLKLKSIVDKTLPDDEVSFTRKTIESGQETFATFALTEQGDLIKVPLESVEILKYEQQPTAEDAENKATDQSQQGDLDPIDGLLKKLSPHNLDVFSKEVQALYDKIYEPQLNSIRKGLFSVISRETLLAHYPDSEALLRDLVGAKGKLTDAGWQERTKLAISGNVQDAEANRMITWFWDYMNAQSEQTQSDWYQIISGQPRFHPYTDEVMTLKILPKEESKNGITWCRAGAHTCSNTFDLSVVETQTELDEALDRTFHNAKDQMYAW